MKVIVLRTGGFFKGNIIEVNILVIFSLFFFIQNSLYAGIIIGVIIVIEHFQGINFRRVWLENNYV